MDPAQVAVATALAWGAGLRAYAVIFLAGLAGAMGWFELPQHLRVLQDPLVLGASGFMTAVEFFADKVPWLDSLWDTVHSFIRIPAGAALAAGVFGDGGTALALAAAILGGSLAAGVHFTKAGTRAAINTSPEPVSNWTASFAEDAAVPAGLWLAVAHPIAFFVFLLLFVVGAIFLLRYVWRGLRRIFSRTA